MSKLLFVPFGLWLIFAGGISIYLFYRLTRIFFWKKTTGKIIKSHLKKDNSTLSYDTYLPDVEYEYTVKGKKFTGNKIFISDFESDRETIQQLINKFPEGSTVTVFYNPFNPSESILLRSYHSGMFIQLLVFFSMLSVFIFTLVFEIIYYGSDLSNTANFVKSFFHRLIYGEEQ